MSEGIKNKGWTVASAGTGINLALGILYTWSIFKGAIEKSINEGGAGAFNWDIAKLNDPYSLCCLAFAFSMILAGKCQDKFGPRVTAFIGGILVGLGLLLISQSSSYVNWVVGFGLLVGTGIGFGYSSATPPALKWFPAAKTGLIAGLVVAGFGLASVWSAPTAEYLLKTYGIHQAMLIFGGLFTAVVCGLSLFLVNPPAGYVPGGAAAQLQASTAPQNDAPPSVMMKSDYFWTLWIIYFIAAGVGLMIIGSVSGMAKKSMGDSAFIAVVILAIGNAAGRIVAGIVSDKLGRKATLIGVLLLQAALMIAAIPLVGSATTSALWIVLLATFIGFNYGANLSLFPALTKDRWGLKSFGMNYGILFTAWGLGGFVMSRMQQMLTASTGSFSSAFIIATILLILATVVTLTLKTAEPVAVPEKAEIPEGAIFQPQLGLTMADGGEKIEKDDKKK
ncbi:MAG: oxalate/formate antiporter [Syntrophaceae bacterium]|nr:MAG: oxalate/formate antiporter [Syntrophaceae bacterium]